MEGGNNTLKVQDTQLCARSSFLLLKVVVFTVVWFHSFDKNGCLLPSSQRFEKENNTALRGRTSVSPALPHFAYTETGLSSRFGGGGVFGSKWWRGLVKQPEVVRHHSRGVGTTRPGRSSSQDRGPGDVWVSDDEAAGRHMISYRQIKKEGNSLRYIDEVT